MKQPDDAVREDGESSTSPARTSRRTAMQLLAGGAASSALLTLGGTTSAAAALAGPPSGSGIFFAPPPSAAGVKYYTITGQSFRPRGSADVYVDGNFGELTADTGGLTEFFEHNLRLPDGATLVTIDFYVRDNVAGGVDVAVWRYDPSTNTGTQLAATTSAGAVAGVRAVTLTLPANTVIDNNAFAYIAGVVFDTAGQSISGARIGYRQAAAGDYFAVTPGRVYDSRQGAPLPGVLASGDARTISVADRRNTTGGTVAQADFVPAGATAVVANVTIASQSGGGYLAINPGGTTDINASIINWTAAGQVLANGVVLALNSNRQLTIVAGEGGGTTHVIIDVLGYFR